MTFSEPLWGGIYRNPGKVSVGICEKQTGERIYFDIPIIS